MRSFIAPIFAITSLTSCSGNGSKKITVAGMTFKTIPGLTAVDVTGNFKKAGFVTKKDLESELNTWTCTYYGAFYEQRVVATGKGSLSITSVTMTSTVLHKEELEEKTKDFFGFAASLPYEGSFPIVAKQWASAHCMSGGDTTLGGVKISIGANAEAARVMRISMP